VASKNRLSAAKPKKPPRSTLIGLAFDAEDGHKRLTRGDNFVLFGGSSETHDIMRETTVKVTEKLADRGKRLEDVSPQELRDIFEEVLE